MGIVIEIKLCKSVVSYTRGGVNVLHPIDETSIDIPIPSEINHMLDQGYLIRGVHIKETPLSNFGPGGIFNGESQNF